METPYGGEMKVCTNVPCHMTKIRPPHPYKVKKTLKIFSGTKRTMALDFVCSIGDVGHTKLAQMMKLG